MLRYVTASHVLTLADILSNFHLVNVSIGPYGDLILTNFPLVQLVKKQIMHIWSKMPVKGAHAFAIDGKRALFAGGYRENRQQWSLVILDSMSVEKIIVVDENGTPLSFQHACGHGSRFYFTTEEAIFMLNLDIIESE